MSLQWLQQQRSTPSFASGSGVADNLQSALDQPLPAALREFGEDNNLSMSNEPIPFRSDASVLSPRPQRSPSHRKGNEMSTSRARSAGSTYTSHVVDSRGMKRPINVFESLVERGKLSAEMKDKQRIEAVKQEMRRCRSVPKINRMADDGGMAPTTSIFQRLWNKEMEKQARHHTKILIMKKKEDEMFSTLFQPRISNKGHRSRGATSSATSSEKYSFKTLHRMEEIRKEKIMKEMEMMMETPDINPRSSALAQKQREKEGLAGYTHIEAMIERDRLSKLARYEQREREIITQNSGTPRITEYAAGLDRGPESAHERLYRSIAARERQPPEQLSSIYTPHGHKSEVSEFTSLASHEVETRARRDEKIRALLEAESHSHIPKINPVSASIAARLPTTTEERLSVQTPRRATTTLSKSASEEISYHKKSNDTPSERDVQLFERLRIAEARRKMRVDAAKHELEQKRGEECTFSPVTTTGYYPPQRHMGEDLYQRSSNWQQIRDDRIQQQKELQREDVEKGLTFQPAISRKTQEMFDGSQYNKHRDEVKVSGFDSFVQRQQRAHPKDRHIDSNESTWDASTSMGTPRHTGEKIRNQAPLSSIRRPVEPPSATRSFDAASRAAGSANDDMEGNAFSIAQHTFASA